MNSSIVTLAGRANREHRAAEQSARKAIGHAIECGRLPAGVKDIIGPGGFGQWLADNFEDNDWTARGYGLVRGVRHDRPNLRQRAPKGV